MQFIAMSDGSEFIVDTECQPPSVLTVIPAKVTDGRCILVLVTTDTDTGEEAHSVRVPRMHEGEHEMWANAIEVAGIIMACGLEQVKLAIEENNGLQQRNNNRTFRQND